MTVSVGKEEAGLMARLEEVGMLAMEAQGRDRRGAKQVQEV